MIAISSPGDANSDHNPQIKRFGYYVSEGNIRKITFKAATFGEAHELAKKWGIGLRGEFEIASELVDAVPTPPPPEAYNVEDTCRMLGGVSRVTLYRWVVKGLLKRVSKTRKVLITRDSIIRRVSGQN